MNEQPTPQDRENFFGGIIYAYTRAQAVADGAQISGHHDLLSDVEAELEAAHLFHDKPGGSRSCVV